MDKQLKREVQEYLKGLQTPHCKQIKIVLDALDETSKAIVLFYLNGGSYKQSMSRFYMSEGTFYSRINNFFASLRLFIKTTE